MKDFFKYTVMTTQGAGIAYDSFASLTDAKKFAKANHGQLINPKPQKSK